MAEPKKREAILLLSEEQGAPTRALLEADGWLVHAAANAGQVLDLLKTTRARTVFAAGIAEESLAKLGAEVAARRPDVDFLRPASLGAALIDGGLERRRVAQLARDALQLLGNTVERAAGRPASVDRCVQLAELVAARLGLGRLHVEATATVAVLAAMAPGLAKFLLGGESSPDAQGGASPELRMACAAAATLRSPHELEEIAGALEERFDGRGRPRGLKGDAIPIEARIVSVVKDYVVLAQGEQAAAVAKIQARGGTDHDPRVVDALFRVVRDTEYVQRLSQTQAGPTVFVVDGDAAALAVAELRLGAAGLTVKTYSDGRAAEAALAASTPDAVISELAVPKLDGLSLLLKLRRTPATKELPFFIATTAADRVTATKALKLGATDVLTKPVNFDVLVAKLREGASKKGTPATAAGVQGDIAELAVTDLLQVLAFGRKTATIELEGATGKGTIVLEVGEPVAANLGALAGRPAFLEMAVWKRGKFRLVAASSATEPNLDGNLESLLLEAMRVMDEAARG